MSLGSPSIPAAPGAPIGNLIDPFSLASTQQAFNVASGIANQAGSLPSFATPNYSQGVAQIGTGPGGVPLYGVAQQFSPETQALWNNYTTNQNRFGQDANQLLYEGSINLRDTWPMFSTARDTFGDARKYEDYAGSNLHGLQAQNPSQIGDMSSGLTGQRMQAYFAGIQPFQQTQRDQLDNQLRNQGLAPGMPGYDNALRQLDTSQGLALSQAAAQFQPQAWQQATQVYMDPAMKAQQWEGLAGAETGTGSAQTNLAQSRANTSMAQMTSALPFLAASAPSMPPSPSFPGLNIQPTNVAGLGSSYNSALGQNYQNQLAAFNAENTRNQNMLSGLFGVGSSVLGGLAAGGLFSDRALKENIEPVRISAKGIPLYSFNYKWGGPTIIGPMVDEVEQLMPEAVREIEGFKLVNYAMVQ